MDINEFPITFIYSEGYKNDSGQVLEIDNSLIPSGHVWNRLTSVEFLSPTQVALRGASTQILIDRGYIRRVVFSPVVPRGYLYMESPGGFWFKIDVEEIAPADNPDIPEVEEVNLRHSLSLIAERVSAPPLGSYLLDFTVSVPQKQSFLMELAGNVLVGVRCLPDGRVRLEKRNSRGEPLVASVLAFPKEHYLQYLIEERAVRMMVSDDGVIEWAVYGLPSASSYSTPDGDGYYSTPDGFDYYSAPPT